MARRDVGQIAAVGWVVLVAMLASIGALLTYFPALGWLRSWDSSVNRRLVTERTDLLNDVSGVISRLGDAPAVIAIAAIVTASIAIMRVWRLLALLPGALVIELTAFLAVNYVVRRPRPDVAALGSVPSTFSYPSGHVAATLVIWLSIVVVLRWFAHHRAATTVMLIGAVHSAVLAWARVYRGHHHPTDTMAGVLLGVAAVAVSAAAVRRWSRAARVV